MPQKNPSLLYQAPYKKNEKRKPEAAGKVIVGRTPVKGEGRGRRKKELSSSSLKIPKLI